MSDTNLKHIIIRSGHKTVYGANTWQAASRGVGRFSTGSPAQQQPFYQQLYHKYISSLITRNNYPRVYFQANGFKGIIPIPQTLN